MHLSCVIFTLTVEQNAAGTHFQSILGWAEKWDIKLQIIGYFCTYEITISYNSVIEIFREGKIVHVCSAKVITDPNMEGEMLVKLPTQLPNELYFNDPQNTKDSFSRDGFYKTGQQINWL